MNAEKKIICKRCNQKKPAYKIREGYFSNHCDKCHKERAREYSIKNYRDKKKIMILNSSVNRWKNSSAEAISAQIDKMNEWIEEKQKYIDALEELLDSKD